MHRRSGAAPLRLTKAKSLSRRLLLRHAVQRAQPPDEIAAVDADHLALGKQLSQSIQRGAIVGIAKHRHQHQLVGNVKIGIAGGQPLSFKVDRLAAWAA